MKIWTAAILLIAVSGCAGPREMPKVEPPAAPEPEATADAATPVGAWTSVSLTGPGSASLRRIDLLLHRDGRYFCIGEGDGAPVLLAGRWTLADGVLTVEREGGKSLRFECRREGAILQLRDQEGELRLAPLRD